VTKPRIRNLLVPVALAVLAAVLVGIYIISYRNNVNEGAGLVKVLVASRDIPAGTDGSTVASAGYLKTETVPERALVDGSVASAAPLTSRVVTDPIYRGEQITLRQFKPLAQGGIFAKFSGKQRAVSVLGTPDQMLAGTLEDGDHVDVVATVQYHTPVQRATARVILRNLLVLAAPDADKAKSMRTDEDIAATLVMTDRQAQTMAWAMKMSTWLLALRPTKTPRDSKASLETLHSVLERGLPARAADAQITGDFPEGVDAP
jgi:Flp pilus assembly protein CpaB